MLYYCRFWKMVNLIFKLNIQKNGNHLDTFIVEEKIVYHSLKILNKNNLPRKYVVLLFLEDGKFNIQY